MLLLVKRDNQVFECFSPFPFSSGHAGHHRKSKREVEAKGKHIDKVNVRQAQILASMHQCQGTRSCLNSAEYETKQNM